MLIPKVVSEDGIGAVQLALLVQLRDLMLGGSPAVRTSTAWLRARIAFAEASPQFAPTVSEVQEICRFPSVDLQHTLSSIRLFGLVQEGFPAESAQGLLSELLIALTDGKRALREAALQVLEQRFEELVASTDQMRAVAEAGLEALKLVALPLIAATVSLVFRVPEVQRPAGWAGGIVDAIIAHLSAAGADGSADSEGTTGCYVSGFWQCLSEHPELPRPPALYAAVLVCMHDGPVCERAGCARALIELLKLDYPRPGGISASDALDLVGELYAFLGEAGFQFDAGDDGDAPRSDEERAGVLIGRVDAFIGRFEQENCHGMC
jgi:hypothetical protein